MLNLFDFNLILINKTQVFNNLIYFNLKVVFINLFFLLFLQIMYLKSFLN